MLEKKIISRKNALLAAGAILGMFALAPYASADTIRINFSGNASSGYADLTVVANDHASPDFDLTTATLGERADHDPEGALLITDASGTFNGRAITGVKARNYATPPANEALPYSYSNVFAYDPGTQAYKPNSYDNLFYPNGSPLICFVNGVFTYPFSGGFLDIFGVMFTLQDGDLLGLWSDGDTPAPGGPTYGLSLLDWTPTDSNDVADYTMISSQSATASVPAPHFMWLFGVVLIGLFAWRRSAESRNKLPQQAAA